MNNRLSILTVTVGKECSRRSVREVGQLSCKRSVYNRHTTTGLNFRQEHKYLPLSK